ncbi:hypothetical protein Nmel_017493 [Mimus melanotis]
MEGQVRQGKARQEGVTKVKTIQGRGRQGMARKWLARHGKEGVGMASAMKF